MESHLVSVILRIVVSTVFLCVSLVLVIAAIRDALDKNTAISRRLDNADAEDTGSVFKDKNLLARLGHHLTLPGPEEITRIRYRLAQAGLYGDNAVQTYYAVRVLSILLPQFLLLCAWPLLTQYMSSGKVFILMSVLLLAGMMGPDFYIKRRKSKRVLQAREGFPDMLDLMLACIEAGLGLDAAMARVTAELGNRYPVLKVNLDIMNLELRAGRDRHQAFLNFAERIDVDDAKSLAVMLKQSEEMGSSMGTALRTFSDEMRLKRMLKAEEKALALSAKLTVPLILFIFPTIMVMLMMPAGVRVIEGLSL